MSKFIHVGNSGRNVVAQEGVVPEVLTPKPPAPQAAPAAPAKPNYFQLAGLDATGNTTAAR